MRIITFDGYDSLEVVNEPMESDHIECKLVQVSNIVVFETERQKKETLTAFREIVSTEIIFD